MDDKFYKITGGPSKFDLMVSLFDQKPVKFTIDGIGEIEIIIDSVSRQSKNSEFWDIKGTFVIRDTKDFRPWIQGRYSTDDHSGLYRYHKGTI